MVMNVVSLVAGLSIVALFSPVIVGYLAIVHWPSRSHSPIAVKIKE